MSQSQDPGIQHPNDLERIAARNAEAMEKLVKALEAQKEDLAKHGANTNQTVADLKEAKDAVTGIADRLAESEKAIEALQLKVNRKAVDGGTTPQLLESKSLGELFVESEQYKSAVESGNKRSLPMKLKTFEPYQFAFELRQAVRRYKEATKDLQVKAATLTTAAGSGGSMVDLFATLRLAQVVQAPFERMRLSQLLTTTQTSDQSIQYVRETQFNRIYTEIASEAASGQANVTVDNALGFREGATVTLDPDGVAEQKVILSITGNVLTMSANLASTHAVDKAVVSDRYVYTAETTLKPQARQKYETVTRAMKTLATWVAASRQMLRSPARMRTMIDQRLMESLNSQIDFQILYGDGSETELNGLLTESGVQTYAWSDGIVGDTKIDAIRRAYTLVALGLFDPTGTVLNHQDWEEIELAKGDDEHYIWWSVVNQGVARIWGLPVVATTSIEAGDFAVGAWNLAGELFELTGESQVRFSEEHEDFFTRNMVAILAERNHVLANYLPESIVAGSFDAAPTP